MKIFYSQKLHSHLPTSKKYFFATKIFILLFAFLGMANVGAGQTVINENIQSWTNQASYGIYTQSISAGTVNMTQCIVTNNATATGTCTKGRVQMNSSTGIIEFPALASVGIVEFHLAAGGTNRSVKLQWYDGSTWADLTTFTGIGTTGATYTYTVNKSGSVQLRLASPSNPLYVHDIIVKLISCTPPSVPTGTISGTTPACIITSLSYSPFNANLYWQTAANGTSTANPVTSSALSVSVSADYYVRAYNGTCWSNGAKGPYTVTINKATAITTQPTPQTVTTGNTATFSVVASNNPTYQWQVSTNGGSSWTNVATGTGGTSASYTTAATTIGMNNYKYQCLVTSAAPCTGVVTSNAVALSVNDGPCLEEGFDGFTGSNPPTDWTFTNMGGPYTTVASSGKSPNSLKFDATGDQIVTPSVTNATSLSFWILGNSTDVTSALLVEGYNGTSWVSIDNLANLPTTSGGTTFTYNSSSTPALSSGFTRFRFTYTKSLGNLAFDDVVVFCGNPTPTMQVQGNAINIPSGDVTPSSTDGTDFGSTNTNTDIIKTFTITNTGGGYLILDPITPVVLLDGTQGFSVTQPVLFSIPPNGSTNFTVKFNKGTPGIFEETVRISSNDAANSGVYDFAITAEAVCSSPSTVTSFTPTSGPIGTRIYIKGSGFTGNSAVNLSGLPVSNYSITGDTLIVAQIAGHSGKLQLTDAIGCITQSAGLFTLIDKSGDCKGGVGTPSDLVVSEVYDALKGSLSYIQIFNGTGSTISLSGYSIQVKTGGTINFPLTVSNSIAAGGIYVLRLGDNDVNNELACGNIYNQTEAAGGFNGDDTIILLKAGVIIDWVPNPYLVKNKGFSQKRKFTSNLVRPNTTYNPSDWEIFDDEDCSTINVVPYDLNGKDVTINTQPADNTTCVPTISMAGTSSVSGGISYTWYYNDPKNMTGWSLASGLTAAAGGTTNSYSIGATAPPDYYGYQFYVSVNSGGSGTTCIKPTQAVEYKFPTKPYYETISNGVWNNGGQWKMSDNSSSSFISACKYPISLTSDDVVIKHNVTLPITLEVDQLTISANNILSNSADVILGVTNNLIIDGSLNLNVNNQGTLLLSGKNDQTISGSGTNVANIWNLQFANTNGAKVINNKELGVFGKMSFNPLSKLDMGTGDISIKSTATNTANVSAILNANAISYSGVGRFIVERYFQNHKAWHFLSVPTKGSTFHDAWQEGSDAYSGNGGNKNLKPGYGTILTGTSGTTGYDFTSPQASLKYFDNTLGKYIQVSNTNDVMNSLGGYMVFIRGDRSVAPDDKVSFSSTTLRTKGKMYALGTEAPTTINVPKNTYALVGNPYPSAIDFTKLTTTNLTGTYYVWDPNLADGYTFGAFQTINGGAVSPGGGGYSVGTPFIQSGQSFFVQAMETLDGTISIPESAKVDESVVSVFKTGTTHKVSGLPAPDAQIRGILYRMVGYNESLVDGSLTLFNNDYDNLQDHWDAEKLSNPSADNMGIRSNGKILAIERKHLPQDGDTIFYKMNYYKVGAYRFKFMANKLDVSGQDAYLYDKFLNVSTPLSANDTTLYDFTIKSSPAGSWDENRFGIVFKSSLTTPVTLLSIKAYTQNKNIVVEWEVENESNMRSYTVETSTDGKTFINGGTVAAKNGAAATYQWLDANVVAGYHYYRILSTELDGKSSYSKIVRVLVGNNNHVSRITIYPNPIKDGVINLQFDNQEAGIYQLHLLNTVGQVMMTKTINHPGGSSSELLMLNSTISKGIYHLEIYKGNVRVMSEKVAY